MAVTQPKKSMSKDDIIETLRRNAQMFKDEPEFVTYIVDLAMYLIENFLEREERKPAAGSGVLKVTPSEIREVYNIFQRFPPERASRQRCPMCDFPIEGKRKCPNCDAMAF